MNVIATLSDETFLLNGTILPLNQPLSIFENLLGRPNRVFKGQQLAPTGYRNNHRHIYDALGITLLDHWADQNIHDLTIHLAPTDTFGACPNTMFTGTLILLGHRINASSAWSIVKNNLIPPFRKFLGVNYSAKVGVYHISLEFVTLRVRDKNGTKNVLSSVSVSLSSRTE